MHIPLKFSELRMKQREEINEHGQWRVPLSMLHAALKASQALEHDKVAQEVLRRHEEGHRESGCGVPMLPASQTMWLVPT